MELAERFGASLRRAPYVWLALTILLYLMLSQPVSTIVTRPRDASTPIALAAAVVIACGVVWSVFVVPRVVLPRSQPNTSDNRIALMRWGFAGFPVVVGISAVAFGGQSWAFVLGSVVSMALTVHAARTINRVADAR
jgi:hypothetical protein